MTREQKKQLAEIEGREKSATPGPWMWDNLGVESWPRDDVQSGDVSSRVCYTEKLISPFVDIGIDELDDLRKQLPMVIDNSGIPEWMAPYPDSVLFARGKKSRMIVSHYNAAFIAHARQDIPFLLALVKEQQVEIERLMAVTQT